ncbi:hypothetical protein ACQKEX_15105 [Bacillus pumilus]|uniref:hypothetical protein n=1 Tax=Bacillus TaxID=1386 RepID=UPI00095BA737|nr:hypothetical protein [Bacillus pumilus]MBU8576474.1 hypothetical protein [Bacillus pumilus]OLP64326.1 hypothetical protein BACPU_25510 [Bacillus pumilus]
MVEGLYEQMDRAIGREATYLGVVYSLPTGLLLVNSFESGGEKTMYLCEFIPADTYKEIFSFTAIGLYEFLEELKYYGII